MSDIKDVEYRALVEAGPAVVMVAKADMLKLLDRVSAAEDWAQFGRVAYQTLYAAKEESRNAYERLNFRIQTAPPL
jgi:hypothetical protein